MKAAVATVSLCVLMSASEAAAAERATFKTAVPSDVLASCMYRTLRSERQGQMQMAELSPPGTKEVSRTMNGGGYSVFMWRVEIKRSGPKASIVEAEFARPMIGSDTYSDEIQQTLRACGA